MNHVSDFKLNTTSLWLAHRYLSSCFNLGFIWNSDSTERARKSEVLANCTAQFVLILIYTHWPQYAYFPLPGFAAQR